MARLWADILTRDLPNTKQENYTPQFDDVPPCIMFYMLCYN